MCGNPSFYGEQSKVSGCRHHQRQEEVSSGSFYKGQPELGGERSGVVGSLVVKSIVRRHCHALGQRTGLCFSSLQNL